GAYLLKGAILFFLLPSLLVSFSFFGPCSLILVGPTVDYSHERLFSRQSWSLLSWRDCEECKKGGVFDKTDSSTQTHVHSETYCLDPGGFSIQQCVFPKKLLQEEPRPPVYSPPPSAHDPNIVGDSAPPEGSLVRTDRKSPRETNPNEEKPSETGREREEKPAMNPIFNSTSSSSMALISNALAAYTYISDHPERAALFFVCGVCLGLFLTLFALVVQISCRTDCQPRQRPPTKKRPRPADSSSDSSDSDSDWDTTSDLSARRHRRFERTLNMNVFTSAEELERAQRLEERERIIREIWMNGQPDIPGTRSLNRYY
uniref:EVA1 domain-containing protein n=1 Tax=Sphaeramia orbicularis TaxID=375764 RepID=A0A672YCD0_9TELE